MWIQKCFSELGISEDETEETLASWLNNLEELYYIDDKIIMQPGNSNTTIVAVKVIDLSVPGMEMAVYCAQKERIFSIFEEN